MPLISSDYISTLNVVYNKITGNQLLLESYDNKQTQDNDIQKLIQGALGPRVMNTGGMAWNVILKSPVYIMSDPAAMADALGVFTHALGNPLFRLYDDGIGVMILESCSLNIGENGVDCNVSLAADSQYAIDSCFEISNSNGLFVGTNLIGRTAKFYDTGMALGNINCKILSGNLDFKVTKENKYFINATTQEPNIAVNGYTMSGSLTIAVPAYLTNDQTTAIFEQMSGGFSPNNTSLWLAVGPHTLDFRNTSVMYKEITKKVEAGKISQATLSFDSYGLSI